MSTPAKTSSRSFLSHKRVNLAANGEVTLNLTGEFFVCTEAQGKFELALGHGAEWVPFHLGMKARLSPGDYFERVALRDVSGAANSIEFLAGSGEFDDQRLNVVRERPAWWADAPTLIKSADISSIGANTALTFTGWGVPGSGFGQRKSIIVTNLDVSSDLEVLDVNDKRVATVLFRQAWMLETSDSLKVKNETAAPIACRIAEVFYEEA